MINANIKNSVNNKSLAKANEQGILRWENILGVTSPINSTLQARRDALKAKLMSKPPINLSVMQAIIEAYLGVSVEIEAWWNSANAPYHIKVYYKGTNGIPNLVPLYSTLYDIIPANLIVHILYRYNSWGEVKDKNSSWGVTINKTWNTLKMGG